MNQMQQMLVEAQRMQRELQKAHAELEQKEFKVTKAGIVEVVMLGSRKVKSITVDPEALSKDNADMIDETLVMALNEALDKIAEEEEAINEKITGAKGGLPF
jgi:DNA-binding YbaB/EbfC family protein